MAREVTRAVYRISSRGPFAHDYGLRDQMRRAAVSIMSNIAEGFESRTQALFADHRGRAKGSAGELRAQFYVALDAGYITPDEFAALKVQTESCSRLLSRFMTYLEDHSNSRRVRESTAACEYEVESWQVES